MDIIPAA